MTEKWEILWNFETKRFAVRVDWTYDYDTDLSFDDTGEVRAGLESGKFVSFQVRATVSLDGHKISRDYLGGCIYESPAEFRDHIGLAAKARADGHNYGSYFADMVRTVVKDARKTLANLPALRKA